MKDREIYLMKAESEVKHLLSKLNEAEADALAQIAKAKNKINLFNAEIEAVNSKKNALKNQFNDLKNASEKGWEEASKKFIKAVESLEDKSAFSTKTEEWFKTVRESANDLKAKVKEKVSHW